MWREKLGVIRALVIQNQTALIALGSAASGAAIGLLGSKKYFEMKYSKIAEEEINEAARFYENLQHKLLIKDPEVVDLEKIVEHYKTESTEVTVEPTEPEAEEVEEEQPKTASNIFRDSAPEGEWDYDEEVSRRDPELPYVISFEEFNEPPAATWEQTSLHFYEKDGALVDVRDEPVMDELVGGEETFKRFGHGSKDNNVVYVRNERIEVDFEILRSFGSFAEEKFGIVDDDEPHLAHSMKPRKMRRERDD